MSAQGTEPRSALMVKPRPILGLSVLLATFAGGAIVLWMQRQETTLLQSQVELAKFETRDVQQLRDENARWRKQQMSAAELERLRADHAAIVRLKAELEALQQSASATQR